MERRPALGGVEKLGWFFNEYGAPVPRGRVEKPGEFFNGRVEERKNPLPGASPKARGTGRGQGLVQIGEGVEIRDLRVGRERLGLISREVSGLEGGLMFGGEY